MAKGRRASGEGTLSRRKDGMWVAVAHLGYLPDGKRKRLQLYAKSEKAVLDKLHAALEQHRSGVDVLASKAHTVGDLLDIWLRDELAQSVAPNTLILYRGMADVHIKPFQLGTRTMGETKVSDLKVEQVQRMLAAKLEDGYSASTVRRIRAVLVQAFKAAERWGWTVRNPAALSRGPGDDRKEARFISAEEARRLIAQSEDDPWGIAVVLMVGAGLRRGETLGLRWSDIDLEARTLSVARSLVYVSNQGLQIRPTKARSDRMVHLPPELVDALKTHRRRQAERQLAAGPDWAPWEPAPDLVITSSSGGPVEPRRFGEFFAKACEKADLTGVHPHTLRHSAASLMLANGAPLEVVSKSLGHASIRMTSDIYGHLYAAGRDVAAEAIGTALWGSGS